MKTTRVLTKGQMVRVRGYSSNGVRLDKQELTYMSELFDGYHKVKTRDTIFVVHACQITPLTKPKRREWEMLASRCEINAKRLFNVDALSNETCENCIHGGCERIRVREVKKP